MNDTKDEIIEGAKRCFARYGYNKTTLEDIGKSVGLKKNSLYHYFKNKEDIFFIVIRKELEQNIVEYKNKIISVHGIRNKILMYVNLRLQNCNQESILKSILTEVWTPHHVLFNRIFELIRKNEIDFINSLFIEAYNNNEIIKHNYKKLSESILLVCDSIKQQEMSNFSYNNGDNEITTKDKYIIYIIETMLKAIDVKA